MSAPADPRAHRVGALRPNQLLHTYGVGSVADLPNLSVITMGLDFWNRQYAAEVTEDRLLAAVRGKLGPQVQTLRRPPHLPETPDVFADWARTGVPVGLFPSYLRCTNDNCNRLSTVESGPFELVGNAFLPDKIRYVHDCRGQGNRRPTAVPARFVLACDAGHLDDFPWMYFAHRGVQPGPDTNHTLSLRETGSTGEAANIFVVCSCDAARPMSEAFGESGLKTLPLCRGRHPHLSSFESCDKRTRTMSLGATNTWFAMQLRVFSLPEATEPLAQLVAENWGQLSLLAKLPKDIALPLMPTQRCWPELEPYGADEVWAAIGKHVAAAPAEPDDELDLLTPEWAAFTAKPRDLPDFATRAEERPADTRSWLDRVVLVTRLREVAALYGFTRIDAPEWDAVAESDVRRAPISEGPPTWVPCADLRGEGIFLQFTESRLAAWENLAATRARGARLRRGHDEWRDQRRLEPGHWPGLRYVLLHTFAHALIRELALESGYSAAGIGERIYARSGTDPMAGILLYTAAPDSEGTLGGLVSLGSRDSLGALVQRALEAAQLCSSDPLCAEHDPTEHGRLYGSACHACLFAAETSCERGNQYLDRSLLVNTLLGADAGFFGS